MSVETVILTFLGKTKKARTFYDILVGNKIPAPPSEKWIKELGDIEQDEWNSYNRIIKDIKEAKLKEFQFKINNRILVTKSFLYKINKVDDGMCSFCNQHPETILHLFYYCEKVKTFWADLKTWLEIKANIILQLTVKNLLFSKQAHNVLLNYITGKIPYLSNKIFYKPNQYGKFHNLCKKEIPERKIYRKIA